MPRNGTGGYSLPSNSWNPALNGNAATAADWQTLINDVASALQQSVSSDGQTPMTGSLKMGGFAITQLGAPVGNGQSLRWEQLTKGADIASAATIAIPNEGTLFSVTGTTGITAFSGSPVGRVVKLSFVDRVQLTNSASLVLPNGGTFTTGPNDVYEFTQIDAGVWKLTGGVSVASNSLVGNTQGARALVTAASASATFTATQVVVGGSLAGPAYKINNVSKVINLATVGAGGMDTGTAPLSGYVAIYLILNPGTGATALLATNASNALQPLVYGGSSMPTGYTASALISVWPTNGSGQLVMGSLVERTHSVPDIAVASTGTITATYLSSVVAALPRNAVQIGGQIQVNGTAGTQTYIAVASYGSGTAGVGNQYVGTNSGATFANYSLALINPQTVYFISAGAAGSTFNVIASSYQI